MLRRRRQVGGAFQHLEGIVAHMVLAHLLAQELLGDDALGHAFLQQTEEESLLVRVRVLLVLTQKRIFAEQLAAGAHQPAERREAPEMLGRAPVDRQSGLPGLGLAPGGVQHPGCRGELVEVVPFVLEQADAVAVLQAQADPRHVVAPKLEHFLEGFLHLPVAELRAVEQHDAGRHAMVHDALLFGAWTAEDSLAHHVAREQVPHIAGGENVGIDHHRASLIVHQFGRHETCRGERLQVVVQPDALDAVAQVELAFVALEPVVIPGVDDADIEFIVVA